MFGENRRWLRFLLVGAINTLFGYAVFAVLIWFELHYAVAVAGSTILGILFNFRSTGALVFGSRDRSRLRPFVLVYAVVFIVNLAALALLLRFGLSELTGGAVLVLPLAALAYHLNSQYVFKRHETADQHSHAGL